MKKTLDPARLASLSTLAIVMLLSGCGAEKSTGSATTDARKSVDTAIPIYETAQQIKVMPPCKAVVEHIETFSSLLRTSDGTRFGIGSPKGAQEVWRFVGTALKEGQTYEFPGTFLDYKRKQER